MLPDVTHGIGGTDGRLWPKWKKNGRAGRGIGNGQWHRATTHTNAKSRITYADIATSAPFIRPQTALTSPNHKHHPDKSPFAQEFSWTRNDFSWTKDHFSWT